MTIILDIDLESKTIKAAKIREENEPNHIRTLADAFEPFIGTKEYNGVVADIQRWYYGSLIKAPWCATAISYFANKMGILDKIGGKNENVFKMLLKCQQQPKENGEFFVYEMVHEIFDIQRGDVLFWNWNSGMMSITSSKHVGIATKNITIYNGTGSVPCIGGNQADQISVKNYSAEDLYAVYRPNYGGI